MKLTVDLSVLLNAVQKMGAEDINFEFSSEVIPIQPIDTQLGNGLEVNFEDIEFETGLASYKGRQVLLYIKDHGNRVCQALEDGSQGNKYHIADCKTLETMKAKGKFDKYVVTNDLSGRFKIAGTNFKTNQSEDGITSLNVCKNCLSYLNYQGYQVKTKAPIFKAFNLADFFDTFSSFFKTEPSGVADSSNVGYSIDWSDISKRLKRQKNYVCQQCSLYLSAHNHLLHVHHINGVKNDNTPSNLKVLCADCHRKQPDHAHLFIKHLDTVLINELRREQNIIAGFTWKEVFDLSDPAIHGVVSLLEKYKAPLPQIGELVKLGNEGEAIKIELAWPQKCVGIAIDLENAKKASKEGWEVWSMRDALTEIVKLAGSLR